VPSDQTNASDTPASPPSVCVCGYDLSGLPDDATAKCPECGVVVADLVPIKPWSKRWWVIGVALFLFLLGVIGSHVLAAWIERTRPLGYFWFFVTVLISSVFICAAVAVVCIYIDRSRSSYPEWARSIMTLVVIPVLLICNIFVAWLMYF